MDDDQRLMVFDQLQVICQGCKAVRVVTLNPPIIGAADFIVYTKTKLTACPCGATHCDIKARLQKDPNEPSIN